MAPSFPMQLRAIAAFFLLAAVLAVPSRPALAATLAEELAEVTRLHHAGQTDAGIARADVYLKDKPKDAQMRFLKSVLLADAGRKADAAALLQQVSQDYPELPEPHNNLAAIYASTGEFGMARAELEESIRLNPGYATAQENLGDIYSILAAFAYAKAQRLDPKNMGLPRKLALARQLSEPVAGPSVPLPPTAPPKTTIIKKS